MKTQSMIKFLPLLLSLPLLQSCGGPAKSTAELSVSSSFITSAGSLGLGGYIVVAESGMKKFVVSMHGSTQTKVLLDKGIWKFSAVGWDGSQPFEGNTVCGLVPNVDLSSSDTASVEIKVDATTCSSAAVISELNVKSISPLACNIFYNYNQDSNTFTAQTNTDLDSNPNFCHSLPNDYQNEYTSYRIQAVNIVPGKEPLEAFSSECKVLPTAANPSPTSLFLPSNKFPLFVKFYKTTAECNQKAMPLNYFFKDGLQQGNPGKFDHLLSANGSKLLLSSSRTKRGKSPFMKEIPRIHCGASGSFTDCYAEPNVSVHVNVPFYDDHSEQVVLKGLPNTTKTCSPSILNSNKFYTETCKIEDRQAVIRPQRNALTCQENQFNLGILYKDVYMREGKIYSLHRENASDDFLSVYEQGRKRVARYNLGSVVHTQVSVSANGSKAALLTSTGSINLVTLPSNTPTTVPNISGATAVEIDPAGNILYVGFSGYVKSYDLGGNLISGQIISGLVNEIVAGFGYLYVAGPTSLYTAPLNAAGTLSSIDFLSSNTFPTSPISSMTLSDTGSLYVHTGTSGFHKLSGASFTAATNTSSNVVTGLAVLGNRMYLVNDDTLQVLQNGTSTILSSNTGTCNESPTFTLDGISKQLYFGSNENLPLHAVFNEAINIIGRTLYTTPERTFYYFQSLSHQDDGVRTGGRLERPQEMLSPAAIGGLLSDFPTCGDLKAKAPIHREVGLFDENAGVLRNIVIDVKTTTETIPAYICNDANPTGTCSGEKYDLQVEFSHTNTGRREKNIIKLKCDKKLGTFESLDVEYLPSTEIHRERIVWNTNSPDSQRFEFYSYENDDKKRAEVLQVQKTGEDTLVSRKVQTEIQIANDWKHTSVSEFEIDPDKMYTGNISISETLSTAHVTNPSLVPGFSFSYDTYKAAETFQSLTLDAWSCTPTTNQSIGTATTTGCSFTYSNPLGTETSLGVVLNPNGLAIENPGHVMNLTSGGVFTIPAN